MLARHTPQGSVLHDHAPAAHSLGPWGLAMLSACCIGPTVELSLGRVGPGVKNRSCGDLEGAVGTQTLAWETLAAFPRDRRLGSRGR